MKRTPFLPYELLSFSLRRRLTSLTVSSKYFVRYLMDVIFSAIYPDYRIFSRVPPEVFHSRRGTFGAHPLVNFLKAWDSPALSSSFSVLSISMRMDTRLHFFRKEFVRELMLAELASSYSEELGCFLDRTSKRTSAFQSTYYAIKAIDLLAQGSLPEKNKILVLVGADKGKLSNFLRKHTYVDLLEAEGLQPNFSLVEKAATSVFLLDYSLFSNDVQHYSNLLEEYSVFESTEISGFRLRLDEKTSSKSTAALKSGAKLLCEVQSLGDRVWSLDVEGILERIAGELEHESDHDFINQSQLLKLYNIHVTISSIRQILRDRRDANAESDIEQIEGALDQALKRLVQVLNFKGGCMFNSGPLSAPNLYATRLLIELLDERGMLEMINSSELELFLLDCFSLKGSTFRNYPYRSWYYSRIGKATGRERP